MKRIVLAITGASGTRYGRRLLHVLTLRGTEVDLIVSDGARRVLRAEENLDPGRPADPAALVADLGKLGRGVVRVHEPDDVEADIASGSTQVDGVAVVPCSMATMGALASGAGRNLVHRVADVALKERRPLVIAPRETPLSAIHLENMLRLARAGACVLPCAPAFSGNPRSVDDLVDHLVMRIGDQLGLDFALVPRWGS